MKQFLCLLVLASLAACESSDTDGRAAVTDNQDMIKVTGELQSASALYFGPPAVPNIWNYTIAFMAPDGEIAQANTPILGFDTQELMTRMRDKNASLNEKQKELEKQQIVAKETLAELRLQEEEAVADLDKARLKADIPETLLARKEYQENQLLLEHAKLNHQLRQNEYQKEQEIQSTEIEILEQEIAVLQTEVQQLQQSIGAMNIMAPSEGVVIHTRDRRNNKLSVGDNVWMGRRVLEFPDLSQLELHLEIPERESTKVVIGQQVQFTLDAAPDRIFKGEVRELASVIHTKSINQPAKVFDAVVSLSNPDTELMRPGMSVNAEILLK